MSENYNMKQNGHGGMAGAVQTPANAGLGHDKPKVFDAEGAIGKQFTGESTGKVRLKTNDRCTDSSSAENGALGGAAQKIGGPLDKDGAIGKQFTTEGSIGGTAQDKMGGTKGRSN